MNKEDACKFLFNNFDVYSEWKAVELLNLIKIIINSEKVTFDSEYLLVLIGESIKKQFIKKDAKND
jgi:hypothetical protein